jgi:hypothetical protein
MPKDDATLSAASVGSHGLSEAEIDALEYVVVEGRIACMEDYGILRSLLVRLRPEWETNHDALPAATAQAEQATKSSPTDNARATAGCGSDRTDKPAPRTATGAGNTQEPAAWMAFATDGSESSAVYMMREQAQAAADNWGWSIAPLYAAQQPTFTRKELEAIGWAAWVLPSVRGTLEGILKRRQ